MRRRRLSYVCALVTLLTVSSASAAAKPGTSWAQAELKTAVAAGLMAKEAAARPNKPLTRSELETLVAGLTHVEPVAPTSPTKSVTMASLDARLVGALGLTDTAKLFTQTAKDAGLAPPARFGTEAVARLLGLRTNHPAALDALELSPGDAWRVVDTRAAVYPPIAMKPACPIENWPVKPLMRFRLTARMMLIPARQSTWRR